MVLYDDVRSQDISGTNDRPFTDRHPSRSFGPRVYQRGKFETFVICFFNKTLSVLWPAKGYDHLCRRESSSCRVKGKYWDIVEHLTLTTDEIIDETSDHHRFFIDAAILGKPCHFSCESSSPVYHYILGQSYSSRPLAYHPGFLNHFPISLEYS